jgi:hypothetical protein
MTTVLKYAAPTAAGAEVHARAERHVAANGGTYQDAVRAVLKADPELATAYAQPASRMATMATKPAVPVAGGDARRNAPENKPVPADKANALAQGKTPGETVHLRAQALIYEHPRMDYREAMGKDQALLELGGHASSLFLLWVVPEMGLRHSKGCPPTVRYPTARRRSTPAPPKWTQGRHRASADLRAHPIVMEASRMHSRLGWILVGIVIVLCTATAQAGVAAHSIFRLT